MSIAKFDKNMKVETKIEREGIRFFDPNLPPFRMYGVKKYPDKYYRMPDEVAKTVNSGVQALNPCTAGGTYSICYG